MTSNKRTPWNKGKTADTDDRIKGYADKQRGQKREGNYQPQYHWRGEGNPWYGKPRAGELSPRYDETIHSREYQNYYNSVLWFSEKTYKANKDIINPNNHTRTLCGVENGYQLDHIIPITEGWKQGKSVEEMSHLTNLRIIPWKENLLKSNKLV